MQSNTPKPSLYQIVTDRIVASLKEGVIPWEKPWTGPTYAGGNLPRNFRTGKPYRGVSVFLLWSTPFSAPFWLTFKQAQEMGGSVRKGEKGTQIVFYKQRNGKAATEETEEPTEKKGNSFVLTSYTVFNVEQCDGLTVPQITPDQVQAERVIHLECEAIVSGWKAGPKQISRAVECRAYYRPATDTVHMPTRVRFRDTACYYSTLFHELVHSTGHESRLKREFGKSFGDELYSREELVAETGAAFLCAIAGIANEHSERNTTAYLQNWIARLESDDRLILQAAAAAQKAVDLITGPYAEEQVGAA